MTETTIYTVFESAFELNLADLCHSKTIHQINFPSNRKLIAQVKKAEPDFILAEFIYSPSLGTQISSLDGILGTVERFCEQTRLIIYTEPRYREQLESVRTKFYIDHVLEYPVQKNELCSILTS
jgi:hypothetical protein